MFKPIKFAVLCVSWFVIASGFSPSPSTFQGRKACIGTHSLRSAWLCGQTARQSWTQSQLQGRHRRRVVEDWKQRGGTLKLAAREMDDLQPDEAMVEKLVERLESSLDAAIKEERYSEASSIRDELSRMHMDDTSAVLKTNSDFYQAFSSKNIDLMGRVWHKSPHVQCIHPGAKPLLGYEDIVSMWRNMFQAKDKVFKHTGIVPDNVRVQVRGTSAFVTCTEEVHFQSRTREWAASASVGSIAAGVDVAAAAA